MYNVLINSLLSIMIEVYVTYLLTTLPLFAVSWRRDLTFKFDLLTLQVLDMRHFLVRSFHWSSYNATNSLYFIWEVYIGLHCALQSVIRHHIVYGIKVRIDRPFVVRNVSHEDASDSMSVEWSVQCREYKWIN